MLSYRHAFHAGNHADVLKHTVLLELLSYLKRKDKAWHYIDTHAGAGCYGLASNPGGGAFAARPAEHEQGASRVWAATALPAALAGYRAALAQFNPGERLEVYPGSPALAMQAARAQDRLRLFELHPTDHQALSALFATAGKQVQCLRSDGFKGLPGLLPPPSRRALVLIDPSYELKDDYRRVLDCLQAALRRFPQGCYLLWYPLLSRPEVQQLSKGLAALSLPSWLHARLQVRAAQPGQHGMYGSGVFVINPPWILPERLAPALQWLVAHLGSDDGARCQLDHHLS